MKYTIHYSRKIQIKQFESLGISLECEFDSDETSYNEGKEKVKLHVDEWIKIERERLLKKQ